MDLIALDSSADVTTDSLIEKPLTGGLRSSTSSNDQTDTSDPNPPEKLDPSMIRINEIRKMVITETQLNALVTSRYEAWLQSRGYVKPDELIDMMVKIIDDEIMTAFKVETRGFSQIFTSRFLLMFAEDGYATMNMTSIEAGHLPISGGKIREYFADKVGEGHSADKIGEWLSKLEKVRFKPVLDDLPHRRRARIQGYRILEEDEAKKQKQRIELTLLVQDFRTYAEMNQRLKEKFGSELVMTAAVETQD